jgi:ferredoxin
MKHLIHIDGCDEVFPCSETDSLLSGMLKACARGVPVGCRGGGCGVCKIRVISGDYETGAMSASHINEQDKANHVVLACRVYPRSDIRIEVTGKLARRFNKVA